MSQVQTRFLDAALDAARWIRSTASETPRGLVWKPDPDQPGKETTVSAAQTIYSGNAGIVLYLLELARATGDQSYLDDARRGADEIAATWRDVLSHDFFVPIPNIQFDFNHGIAGTAFVLEQVFQATGEPRYRDAALEIIHHIADASRPAGAGVEWIGFSSGAMGDGSVVLSMLWAADAFGDPSLRDLAVQAGDRILEKGAPDPRGGLIWNDFPLQMFGAPDGAYMPNFEFGTAGVAFVLARLAEVTGEARFLAAAREGEAHLESIATVDGDSALLYYREPDMTDLYYLGYCHGPVGTARLPYQLYKVTGEQRYLEWTERYARGIMKSGVPERQTPGLWNVVCQCCGTSGILDLFTSLWIATGKSEYHDFARRVADVLLAKGTRVDENGLRWYQAWTRVKPDEFDSETGYMIGAAGVGSAFLRFHLAELGHYDATLFPDNPFPRTSSRELVPGQVE